MEKNITCNVLKTLTVLKENNGYTKELKLIEWNGANPKLDIREWRPDGRCGKGVTLTDEDAMRLFDGLGGYFNKKAEKMAEIPDGEELPL